jgi:hypothetical protein
VHPLEKPFFFAGRNRISQAYFALHKTLHKFKFVFVFFRKIIILGTKVTSEAFFSILQNLKVFREAHKQNFELVDETLTFQCYLNVFGARSWLRCAQVDGLTKYVVKQNV